MILSDDFLTLVSKIVSLVNKRSLTSIDTLSVIKLNMKKMEKSVKKSLCIPAFKLELNVIAIKKEKITKENDKNLSFRFLNLMQVIKETRRSESDNFLDENRARKEKMTRIPAIRIKMKSTEGKSNLRKYTKLLSRSLFVRLSTN